MNPNCEKVYCEIIDKCLKMIQEKRIPIDEAAYRMGISSKKLYRYLSNIEKDYSLYLLIYDTLLNW